MKTIDPALLRGYKEDLDALRRFESRFAVPGLIGFVSFITGMAWIMIFTQKPDALPVILISTGAILVLFSIAAMRLASPISSTGRPMKKFWADRSTTDTHDIVYVCDDSRTYFQRPFAKNKRRRRGT